MQLSASTLPFDPALALTSAPTGTAPVSSGDGPAPAGTFGDLLTAQAGGGTATRPATGGEPALGVPPGVPPGASDAPPASTVLGAQVPAAVVSARGGAGGATPKPAAPVTSRAVRLAPDAMAALPTSAPLAAPESADPEPEPTVSTDSKSLPDTAESGAPSTVPAPSAPPPEWLAAALAQLEVGAEPRLVDVQVLVEASPSEAPEVVSSGATNAVTAAPSTPVARPTAGPTGVNASSAPASPARSTPGLSSTDVSSAPASPVASACAAEAPAADGVSESSEPRGRAATRPALAGEVPARAADAVSSDPSAPVRVATERRPAARPSPIRASAPMLSAAAAGDVSVPTATTSSDIGGGRSTQGVAVPTPIASTQAAPAVRSGRAPDEPSPVAESPAGSAPAHPTASATVATPVVHGVNPDAAAATAQTASSMGAETFRVGGRAAGARPASGVSPRPAVPTAIPSSREAETGAPAIGSRVRVTSVSLPRTEAGDAESAISMRDPAASALAADFSADAEATIGIANPVLTPTVGAGSIVESVGVLRTALRGEPARDPALSPVPAPTQNATAVPTSPAIAVAPREQVPTRVELPTHADEGSALVASASAGLPIRTPASSSDLGRRPVGSARTGGVSEKFAARGVRAGSDALEANEREQKHVLVPDQEDVGSYPSRLGINVAQLETLMPAPASTPTSPSRPNEIAPAPAVPLTFDTLVEEPAAPASGDIERAAHRAVESAVMMTEHYKQTSQRGVSLQFSVSGVDLSVRVELRHDGVHTTFRTDSPELRSAIAQEWQTTVAAQPQERSSRLADPVFTSSPSSSATSSDAGTNSYREPSRRQEEPARASEQRLASSPRAAAPAPAPKPAPVRLAPLSTALHLHTFA